MWKPFSYSGNIYMFRLEKSENDLNLLLTDFTNIWESQFSISNLTDTFKANNPLIEATNEQILVDLLDIIENIENANISVHISEAVVELVFENCADVSESIKIQKIVYKFKLTKKEQDEFKTKITISAIKTIYLLEKQQQMLINIIQKKDRELEEFKMEKGNISRDDLKTEKFDASTLIIANNEESFLNVFSNENHKDFWQTFIEKNGNVQTANLHVDVEPWNAAKRIRLVRSRKNVVKKGAGVNFKK